MREAVEHFDFGRIAAAIRFLEEAREQQPSLADLGEHLGLSPFHLQRLFQRWAGISPKRFLQALAVTRAKSLLDRATPVLETALAVGLSGPGRLHELFVTLEAITPGEYRQGGAGVEIESGAIDSPFGRAVVATTARGICGLAFCAAGEERATLRDLQRHWPRAKWREDGRRIEALAPRLFGGLRSGKPLAVLVRGTNFQVRVWEALLRIPEAHVASYTSVAAAVGHPLAVRAAASAIGDNPVSWLIPCHRVLRQTGALGGYRWGLERKRAMLAWEAARTEPVADATDGG